MGIVITNGKIVSSKGIVEKDIRIVGEKIEDIGIDLVAPNDEIIDAKGFFVLPGGIDVHTHFEAEAGGMVADTFTTGTKAALVGGTTTIVDFAEQIKGGTLRRALEEWSKNATDKTYTDYGFHMTISDWNENTSKEMEEMVKEGITSFKMFFAYEDLKVDDGSIYEALKRAKELGTLIGFHCENGYIIDRLRKEAIAKGKLEPVYHMETRPPSLEREAIFRLITIAELADTPIYIVHLSSKEGYDEIIKARKKGMKILAETCPQYLLLDKDCYLSKGKNSFEGAKYVISPPLRDEESKKVLWQGIKDEEIDVVATDHCAFNYKKQKELGKDDFTKIPNGAPGVENRYKLIYTYGVTKNRITIERLVEILSENPAKIFGLYPKKGIIQKGSDADIIIFNPEAKSIIRAENQVQNVDYNLYEGLTQYGKFEYVFLRGQMVVKDEKILISKPLGKYQRRGLTIKDEGEKNGYHNYTRWR